jgi:glycosyltransferase involved in cell wall biosynthesis
VKPSTPRTVLWVANLKAAKRPELFVELASHFATCDDTQFLMVGALQDPHYRRLVEGNTLPHNFRYLGKQPLEEVDRLLDSAHIFVNTSRLDGEGFPNTFVQAWLRNVPVVSLDVDPDGILAQRGIGHHCAGSLTTLIQVVRALLDDGRRLQAVGHAAREYAVEAFGERNLQRLAALLEKDLDPALNGEQA